MAKAVAFTGLTRVGLIAVLTALACLGTLFVRIPIPATTGYFNIGDVFVVLAGLWLGPVGGLVVGAVGPTLADFVGFPQFMLATAITKGIEGLLVGLLAGGQEASHARKLAAAIAGASMIVVGYFTFEAFIYPWLAPSIPFFAVTDYEAAVAEVLPNLIQAAIAVAGGVGLWKAVAAGSGQTPKR